MIGFVLLKNGFDWVRFDVAWNGTKHVIRPDKISLSSLESDHWPARRGISEAVPA